MAVLVVSHFSAIWATTDPRMTNTARRVVCLWTMRTTLRVVVLCWLSFDVSSAAPVKAPKLKRQQEHPLVRPVCGALASCTAEACTMPIDVTKVCTCAHHVFASALHARTRARAAFLCIPPVDRRTIVSHCTMPLRCTGAHAACDRFVCGISRDDDGPGAGRWHGRARQPSSNL